MPEPIDEADEVSWLTALDRFDAHIYPVLFAPRGYSKDAALMIWTTNRLEGMLARIEDKLESMADG